MYWLRHTNNIFNLWTSALSHVSAVLSTQSHTCTDPSVAAERRVFGRDGCQAWVVTTGRESLHFASSDILWPRCEKTGRGVCASVLQFLVLYICTVPSNPSKQRLSGYWGVLKLLTLKKKGSSLTGNRETVVKNRSPRHIQKFILRWAVLDIESSLTKWIL